MCSKHQPRGCPFVSPPPFPRVFTCKWPTCCSKGCASVGAPKIQTLCSKWQLKRPKFEPFAQSGSWSLKSTNPVLKMAAGAPKVRTLCSKWLLERQKYEPFARNGSWSAQSTNPVPKIQGGASKVQVKAKAICVTLVCSQLSVDSPAWRAR